MNWTEISVVAFGAVQIILIFGMAWAHVHILRLERKVAELTRQHQAVAEELVEHLGEKVTNAGLRRRGLNPDTIEKGLQGERFKKEFDENYRKGFSV